MLSHSVVSDCNRHTHTHTQAGRFYLGTFLFTKCHLLITCRWNWVVIAVSVLGTLLIGTQQWNICVWTYLADEALEAGRRGRTLLKLTQLGATWSTQGVKPCLLTPKPISLPGPEWLVHVVVEDGPISWAWFLCPWCKGPCGSLAQRAVLVTFWNPVAEPPLPKEALPRLAFQVVHSVVTVELQPPLCPSLSQAQERFFIR